MIDVHHHGKCEFFGHLSGDFQWNRARILRGMHAHSHLDSDNRIGIGVCYLDRVDGGH